MQKDDFDAPYPLWRHFRRWVIPSFAALILVLPLAAGWGGAGLIEALYLELAERRAEVIDRAMRAETPDAWERLRATSHPKQVFQTPDGQTLFTNLGNEVKELGLPQLKIYGKDGLLLFDTNHARIGTFDASPAFKEAMSDGARSVVRKPQPDGTDLYELYVRDNEVNGTLAIVFELYEPTSHLDRLILTAVTPVAISAALFLLAMLLGLARLVLRAQADIDQRTALLQKLRKRLEGFVSSSAVSAARASTEGAIRSERLNMTLFYSDIRGFTTFSESVPPEQVVAFLNAVMGLQIEIVQAHGGDVDKMIGDALLVRFTGEGQQHRAVSAAVDIQMRMAAADFPRGLGIGVYAGVVISGVIGPEGRQDFTVIGDSVNTAARLCAAAGEGEVVADVATVAMSTADGFGAEESITVKGKQSALMVRRYRHAGN